MQTSDVLLAFAGLSCLVRQLCEVVIGEKYEAERESSCLDSHPNPVIFGEVMGGEMRSCASFRSRGVTDRPTLCIHAWGHYISVLPFETVQLLPDLWGKTITIQKALNCLEQIDFQLCSFLGTLCSIQTKLLFLWS
jgi:hypothetical protein